MLPLYKTKTAIDADVRLVTEHRQGLTVVPIAHFAADFQRPARIRIFLRPFDEFVGLNLQSALARFDGPPLRIGIALLGAGTRLASTICSDIVMQPFLWSCRSNSFITRFRAPVPVNLLRNRRMPLSSGVGSPKSESRNRIHESRSRIINSICASLRLCWACRIRISNTDTGSNGGHTPLEPSP